MKRKKWIIYTIILGFIFWALREIHTFLEIDSCLDFGDVWDYEQNICRNDCITWNKIYGCVQIPPEELENFLNCHGEGAGTSKCDSKRESQMIQNLCEKYHAIDPKTGKCNFSEPPHIDTNH